MEASVILGRCPQGGRTYGMRIEKMEDGDWWRTWAFPVQDSQAEREGYDRTPVQGNLRGFEGYPGCPYCGTTGFVQCNVCHKLTCWKGEEKIVCQWCGKELKGIRIATDKFDVTGGDM